VNLLAIHTHQVVGYAPLPGCTCLRAACGAAESGPGVLPSDCTAHGQVAAARHRAVDCPALPADTDLSALWIIVTRWTSTGPVLHNVVPYDRATHREMRGTAAMWDLATGATADEAAQQWQDRLDAMRAEAASREAAELAERQKRARDREIALAALRQSGIRAARRAIARDL
jgi:hypothetical protein